MPRPTSAFILAAGLGTRMRPLTNLLPKPLLPFRGRPILQHVADQLAGWGARDFIVNTHHLPVAVNAWADTFRSPERRVLVSHEPEILGTGGALAAVRDRLPAEPFWLANADVISTLDPAPLIAAMEDPRTLAALWMIPDRGPRTVRVRDGAVVDFAAQDRGGPDTFTFSGLHLLRREVLRYVPPSGFSSIIDAYRAAMADGWTIAGCVCPGSWWSDLGTPEDYLAAHFEGGRDDAWIDPGAVVEPGAVVRRSVVWGGARICAGAVVGDAIVATGSVVRGPAGGVIAPGTAALSPEEIAAVGGAANTVIALPARGSDRSYHRVLRGHDSVMLVRHGTERPENDDYAVHARFLEAAGVRACRVLAHEPHQRFTVLEDLGDRHLIDLVREGDPLATEQAYDATLAVVARLHACADRALAAGLPMQKHFGPSLYEWEHNLFLEQCAIPHLGLPPDRTDVIRAELRTVAGRLCGQPVVLVHRDLQSTNVLFHRGEPALIDFQGMRPGAAAYDLGSLLADPYVELDEPLQLRLLDAYARHAGAPVPPDLFWTGCVQRLVQALGAYGRLGALPPTRRFLAHIPAGRRMLTRALAQLGDLPALAALVRL